MKTSARLTAIFLSLSFAVLIEGASGFLVAKATASSLLPVTTTEFAITDGGEKRTLILHILENFVPRAEIFWRQSDLSEPRTGYYAATGAGVSQPRGAGNIAMAAATLLVALPEQRRFGGVLRETLLEHTIQSIRHEALTNALADTAYKRWGGGSRQAALEMYSWAFAAHLLWDKLDSDTREQVETVVVGEANLLLDKALAASKEGDTGAEVNAWNTPAPALAAVMFPKHPHAAAWEETAIRLAYNASSIAADENNRAIYDQRPLREWMASVNLQPDLSLKSHGFYNPLQQQAVHIHIGDAAVIYAAAERSLPEAFWFRAEEVWEAILTHLATDDGDLAMPAVRDRSDKDFQHLGYLSILATRFLRADAAVFESRALELVRRRQLNQNNIQNNNRYNGSLLGQMTIGHETTLVKRLAWAWWNHYLFGPSPTPTAKEFRLVRQRYRGVKKFVYSDFITAQLDKAIVSISWDPSRPMGLVIPRAEADLQDPLFSYYAQNNLIGSARGAGVYSCDCGSDQFSTAGTIGSRRFSMTAFADGTTVLLDRGEGATFTYSLDTLAGITGERPIWSSAGKVLGDLSGEWMNAADRLGIIVRGGGGMRATDWGERLLLTGSVATGSGDRAALLLPLTDHRQTEIIEPYAVQLAVPDDWSAFSARAADGSRRLVTARWGGDSRTKLVITDERGAPVPEQRASLEDNTATFFMDLGAPASTGQTMRFFIRSDLSLTAQQDGGSAVSLNNDSDTENSVLATYVGTDGSEQSVARTLAGGEHVRARLVGGRLTLAGAELEPLLNVRALLAAVVGKPGRFREVMQLIDRAIEESRSEKPDPVLIAQEVKKAELQLAQIAVKSQLSPALRDTVSAAKIRLNELQSSVFSVITSLVVEGRVQAGEPVSVRASFLNRGLSWAKAGIIAFETPRGWGISSADTEAFQVLAPGAGTSLEIELTPSATAAAGTVAELRSLANYYIDCQPQWHCDNEQSSHGSFGALTMTVDPAFTLTPGVEQLTLAAGGYNELVLHATNWLERPLELTLDAASEIGASVGFPAGQTLVLPASGKGEFAVSLRGGAATAGAGATEFVAKSSEGVESRAAINLLFTDNLALNANGDSWPLGFASSEQFAYPATNAFDGDGETFWASGGGPSAEQPEYLGVDFGSPTTFSSVTVIPRIGYGPTRFAVETSDDSEGWSTVEVVEAVPNAITTVRFPEVTARWVRLRINGSWSLQQSPGNVQIKSMVVRAP